MNCNMHMHMMNVCLEIEINWAQAVTKFLINSKKLSPNFQKLGEKNSHKLNVCLQWTPKVF